jgi:O-antigen/teichoic acid export membrane protein
VTSFGFVTAAIAALAVLVYVVIFGREWPTYLFWGLLAAPALLITQRFSNMIVAWLRASKQFELASAQIVLSGLVNLLLIIFLASWLKFTGFLIALILSCCFNVVFLLIKSDFHFVFRMNKEVLRLIHFGLPLLILGILFDLLRSVDKILIIRYLGFEQMGIYGVATMAAVLIAKIPDSMVIVLIPHFHEKFGEREQVQDLRKLVDRSALAYSLIMTLVIGIAWILSAPFVACFLPQFTPAVPSMKLLLLSTYFFALFYPYSNFLIAIKRHLALFPIIMSALLIQVFLTFFAIKSGLGLIGVASVTIFCYFLNFLGLFAVAARALYSWKEALKSFFSVAAFFAGVAIVLTSLDRWCVMAASVQQTFYQLLIFAFLSFPVFFLLEKEFGALRYARDFFKSGNAK